MIANSVSGEVQIELDGQSYVLRPSWEAMLAIEQGLGPDGSLVGLARKLSRSGPSVQDMALVITETIKAAGREKKNLMWTNYDQEKVKKLIAQGGPINYLKPTLVLIENMLSGGSKKKDEETQSVSITG